MFGVLSMAWHRRLPEEVPAPVAPVLSRWMLAALVAVLMGGLLFLFYAAVPALAVLNVWWLSVAPLALVTLAFAARAYGYGESLSRFEYQQEMADEAHQAWHAWAQRGVAVLARCVLLPDQVSAQALVQGQAFPARTGRARRLAGLSTERDERLVSAVEQVLSGLAPVLKTLPINAPLAVTLLTDLAPKRHAELSGVWQRSWSCLKTLREPSAVAIVDDLPLQWIEDRLKNASTAFELVVVLQLCGEADYSDGLAGLLLCPDAFATQHRLPVTTSWLRPMPLSLGTLEDEFALFMQTQRPASRATGFLLDKADWQPLFKRLLASGGDDVAMAAREVWTVEALCGVPGPFAPWLLAALGADGVAHRQQPLLLLTQDRAQHWISTITTKESV